MKRLEDFAKVVHNRSRLIYIKSITTINYDLLDIYIFRYKDYEHYLHNIRGKKLIKVYDFDNKLVGNFNNQKEFLNYMKKLNGEIE